MQKDMFGQKWYKVGLHIHTTLSDGRKTPEQVAEIYKEAGFDAIAITDHWKFYPQGEIGGLTIISGCEYNLGNADTTRNVMHIVGVGMTNDPSFDSRDIPKQEVIDTIKRLGGLAILAHPAWSLNTADSICELTGFDGVEIYNTVSNIEQSSRPYSGYIIDILSNMGTILPIVATDDAHYYGGKDETKSYLMVKAKSNSQQDILDAIRNNNHYSTQGPELHVERVENKIIVHCSECVTIDFLSNSSWVPDKMLRGENLTYAEYCIKEWEKWVRVEVCDKDGCFAWSNIIKL